MCSHGAGCEFELDLIQAAAPATAGLHGLPCPGCVPHQLSAHAMRSALMGVQGRLHLPGEAVSAHKQICMGQLQA